MTVWLVREPVAGVPLEPHKYRFWNISGATAIQSKNVKKMKGRLPIRTNVVAVVRFAMLIRRGSLARRYGGFGAPEVDRRRRYRQSVRLNFDLT